MKHFTTYSHENIKIVENIETDENIGQLILWYISDIVYRIFSTIMIFKTIWFFRHSRWYISPSHNIPDILDILYTFDISNSGIFSQYFWQFWYTRQFNKYRYYPYSQQFRYSKQSPFFCSFRQYWYFNSPYTAAFSLFRHTQHFQLSTQQTRYFRYASYFKTVSIFLTGWKLLAVSIYLVVSIFSK